MPIGKRPPIYSVHAGKLTSNEKKNRTQNFHLVGHLERRRSVCGWGGDRDAKALKSICRHSSRWGVHSGPPPPPIHREFIALPPHGQERTPDQIYIFAIIICWTVLLYINLIRQTIRKLRKWVSYLLESVCANDGFRKFEATRALWCWTVWWVEDDRLISH